MISELYLDKWSRNVPLFPSFFDHMMGWEIINILHRIERDCPASLGRGRPGQQKLHCQEKEVLKNT